MTTFEIDQTLRQIRELATQIVRGHPDGGTDATIARSIVEKTNSVLKADAPKAAPDFLLTAALSHGPNHEGDGYKWGGDAIVTFSHHATGDAPDRRSINFGADHMLAQKIVDRLVEQ